MYLNLWSVDILNISAEQVSQGASWLSFKVCKVTVRTGILK